MKKALILTLVIAFALTGCTLLTGKDTQVTISLEQARILAADFINSYLIQDGSQVTIKAVTQESNLYKIVIVMPNGQEFNTWLTLDGKLFFGNDAMNIEQVKQEAQQKQSQGDASEAVQLADLPKQSKPVVELFVMSHCPYGTQVEKGIIPAIKELGENIDFELKFCDYAMHGQKEIDEQLTQYCIQEEYPDKLLTYLECFLADETKSAECLGEAGVSTSKINTCVTQADKEYKITENFKNNVGYRGQYPGFEIYKSEATEYGVQGSPSLVVNGKMISSGRSPAALLSTICAGFEDQPEECAKQLSATTPAAGFGYGGSGTDAGGCGG